MQINGLDGCLNFPNKLIAQEEQQNLFSSDKEFQTKKNLKVKIFGYSMMNISKFLPLFLIPYIFIVGLPDVLNSFSKQVVHRDGGFSHSNAYLLLGREFLLFLVLIFYAANFFSGRITMPRISGILLFSLIVLVSVTIAVFRISPITGLIALRTYQYIPLAFVFYSYSKNSKSFTNMFHWLIGLLCIVEFGICVLQTQLMPYMEGQTFFGARVIGSFNNPNTIGAVGAFGLYYILFVAHFSRSSTILLTGINILTVLMSGSRGAIVSSLMVLVFFFILKTKSGVTRLMVAASGIISVAFLTIFVGHLAGRGNIPPITSDPRWLHFDSILSDMSWLELIFGMGGAVNSNTLYSMAAEFPQWVVVPREFLYLSESSFISMICQVGILGLVTYHFLLWKILKPNKSAGLCLFGLIILQQVSTVVLEVYPINLLIWATFGILLGTRNSLDLRRYTAS